MLLLTALAPTATAAATAAATASAQQDPEGVFGRLLKQGFDLAGKVNDGKAPPPQRAAAAKAALARLKQAAGIIPQLPAERRAPARFAVGVWRAEVHWRHGTATALQAAAREAKLSRRDARAHGVYGTYYRVQCLMILWQCLSPTAFGELVKDPQYADHVYLFGSRPEADLEKKNATDLIWPLRLMRCDLRILEEELWAVDELRKVAAELGAEHDPDVAAWRHLCVAMLARHYMELRDWGRAQLFVDQLPADSEGAQLARIRIARARQDYDTVIRLGQELGQRNDEYYLFVAEALEARGEYHKALDELDKVFRKPDLTPETRAAAFDQRADCHLRLVENDAAADRQHRLQAADRALGRAWAALQGVDSYQARAERAEILKDQGRLREHQQQPEAALLKFMESIAQLELCRTTIPLDLLGISFLDQDPEQLAAVDGVLRTYADAGYSSTDALVMMDRLKSRDLLDWLAEPPSRENLARYRIALRDVALATDLSNVDKRNQALERLRASDGGQRRGRCIQGGAEMNRLLNRFGNTCFLCYWAGEERIYLLAVTSGPDSTRRLVDLGARGKALGVAADAYTKVSTPESLPTPALEAAAAFFVPASVRPMLTAAQRVVVCPATDLHRLPFAALRIDGKALGIQKELITVPSLAILRELSTRARAGSGLVLVHSATPPAAQSQLLRLGPLRFSEHEANLVASNYHVLATMQGPVATFDNLREVLRVHAGGVGIVHISAHAVEHPYLPCRSLLMLSDGPSDMGSMAALDLAGAVVVLSNCLSRGATARGGEGVSGLFWGPLAAGARAVVASQWHVSQQATADLMGQFHHFCSRGHGEAEALRRARERLAATQNYRHPYYWAAFGVVGAPAAPESAVGVLLRWWWLVLIAGGCYLSYRCLWQR